MLKFNLTQDERRQLAWWIAPALLLGTLVALAIPVPSIGVIRLNDAIYSGTARSLIDQISYARESSAVSAVVLILDSPGGTVVDTEAVYLELARLRQTKPVVTWVSGMAASGAYYLSSGTDYVVAVPSSQVGNVGVIGYLPPTPVVIEDTISTGPYKLWGSPRDTALREIEMIKQGFYRAVVLGRGPRLKIGPDVLLRGQIWPAAEALRLGLVDRLGTESDAYDQAARMAHLWHYQIVDLDAAVALTQASQYSAGFFRQSKDGAKLPYPLASGIYMLYVPTSADRQK